MSFIQLVSNTMAEEWLEMVSDPGLFTLLLKDFGVRGVQLAEIYDVEQPFDGPVYGYLFLFKWSSETRRPGRPRKNANNKPTSAVGTYVQDDDAVRGMFFARQMVPNSCATHALLSVLLNTDTRLHLGGTLERLKERTRGLDPETKGWAIGNTPELARAHNSRAEPERDADRWDAAAAATKRASVPTNVRYVERDTYHYVSYVPIGGRLYELDGLKPYPTDHGSWAEGEGWTAKFRRIVAARMAAGADTGYNLMAVVPDERTEREEPSPVAGTSKQLMEAKEPSPNERTEKESSPMAGTSSDFIEATKICCKLHLSKSKNSKLNESGQLIVFNAISLVWALIIIVKENWLANLSSLWAEYPNSTLSFSTKFFYIIQFAYWAHILPKLYFQKVKKEEMFRRVKYSILYLAFISLVYITNFQHVGVVVLLLHYISEFTKYAVKLIDFTEKDEDSKKVQRK